MLEEKDDYDGSVVHLTPKKPKLKLKRKGHYYDPKSEKKPKWEEGKHRDPDDDGNGGMGAPQPQGIAT